MGILATDTSTETMSKETSRPVKSVAEAKANGYTVGVINRYSAANNAVNNISNMNFHIYQNINSYRKERTVAPVESNRDSRNRSDSSGNGDYVVNNVQKGAIHHGYGSIRAGLSISNQNGSNTQ